MMRFRDYIMKKIGVVGFSDEKFISDDKVVRAYFKQALKDLNITEKVYIVSGTTNMGVPRIAYEEAVKLGYKTVGITAKEAMQYDLFPVDISIVVGEKFGDESEHFLDYIDCMIKIGGGPQSIKEYNTFNGAKVEYDLDKGTYAGIRVTKESNDKIIELTKTLELPNPISSKDIHMTLLYSRKELPNLELREGISAPCTPIGFHVFETFDKKRALVMKVSSDYCTKRHKELMDKHDAMYDFPEYIPHITLSYDIGDMKVPDFNFNEELELASEYEEPLKLEWKPKS